MWDTTRKPTQIGISKTNPVPCSSPPEGARARPISGARQAPTKRVGGIRSPPLVSIPLQRKSSVSVSIRSRTATFYPSEKRSFFGPTTQLKEKDTGFPCKQLHVPSKLPTKTCFFRLGRKAAKQAWVSGRKGQTVARPGPGHNIEDVMLFFHHFLSGSISLSKTWNIRARRAQAGLKPRRAAAAWQGS